MKKSSEFKYDWETYKFKSKEIPWFCTEKLYDKMNNEEAAKRKEKNTYHA